MAELKKNTTFNLAVSIIFLVFGLLLAFQPDFTLNVIINVVGGIFIGLGVIQIIKYISSKKQADMFEIELLIAIAQIIVGLCVIIFGKTVMALFRVIIGIWIIYNGVIKLRVSLMMKKSNLAIWSISIVLSILIIVCGGIITFSSNAVISTIGIGVIIYALIDFIENAITLKNISKIIIYKK